MEAKGKGEGADAEKRAVIRNEESYKTGENGSGVSSDED